MDGKQLGKHCLNFLHHIQSKIHFLADPTITVLLLLNLQPSVEMGHSSQKLKKFGAIDAESIAAMPHVLFEHGVPQ